MTSTDRELEQWTNAWKTDAGERSAPDVVRAHVRRRSLQLTLWLAGEIATVLAALAFVGYSAITLTNPFDRVAMALLAAIIVGASALSWWNWRGTIVASAKTTSEFVQLSVERCRRLRRAIAIGWGILIAELLVLTPWTWYRLYGRATPPSADAERFAWTLLIGISVLAVLMLGALHAGARREDSRLREIERQTS